MDAVDLEIDVRHSGLSALRASTRNDVAFGREAPEYVLQGSRPQQRLPRGGRGRRQPVSVNGWMRRKTISDLLADGPHISASTIA